MTANDATRIVVTAPAVKARSVRALVESPVKAPPRRASDRRARHEEIIHAPSERRETVHVLSERRETVHVLSVRRETAHAATVRLVIALLVDHGPSTLRVKGARIAPREHLATIAAAVPAVPIAHTVPNSHL